MTKGSETPRQDFADSAIAAEVKALLAAGDEPAARERYGDLVTRLQRRATRVAYYYLRDGAEADEAVQDAFIKVYTHLDIFREELSFDVWFTRILVNCCLDRLKAQGRRRRWFVPLDDSDAARETPRYAARSLPSSPEGMLLRRERAEALVRAIGRLPDRQRLVVTLSHLDERTTREVSAITGLNESTVRVHLFRGIRRLRTFLSEGAQALESLRHREPERPKGDRTLVRQKRTS